MRLCLGDLLYNLSAHREKTSPKSALAPHYDDRLDLLALYFLNQIGLNLYSTTSSDRCKKDYRPSTIIPVLTQAY